MTPDQVKREILEKVVHKFCNSFTSKLVPSNEAMIATRLLRGLLPELLDRYAEAIHTYQENGEKAVEQSIIDQHVKEAVVAERERIALMLLEQLDAELKLKSLPSIRAVIRTMVVKSITPNTK